MDQRPGLKISDEVAVEVVDPHNIQPLLVDSVTEFYFSGGILYISFGSMIVDGTAPAVRKVQVCSRIRMPTEMAQHLQAMIAAPESAVSGPIGPVLN